MKLMSSSVIKEDGCISLPRSHEWINSYNDVMLQALRCNMDIKHLFSAAASDGKDPDGPLAFYITTYSTKASHSTHNAYTLISAALKDLEKRRTFSEITSTVERSRQLALHSFFKVLSQQELSGPQVASYMLGLPDHYTSHRYICLHLSAVLQYLDSTEELPPQEEVLLELGNEDAVVQVSQRIDYMFRGNTLSNMSLYEFTSKMMKVPNGESGQTRQMRHEFKSPHPQTQTHQLRQRRELAIPRVVGPFPSAQVDCEKYSKCILALFKPWRTASDLRGPQQSWTEALDQYLLAEASDFCRKIN
jgi:hypothetical protein